VAKGTDGTIGSGVYSVDVEGETSETTVSELSELKRARFAPLVWEQVEREFAAITGGTFGMTTLVSFSRVWVGGRGGEGLRAVMEKIVDVEHTRVI